MRYFITFACYGSHLHGDEPGIVDLHHNVPGSPFAEASPERRVIKFEQMDQAPFSLDKDRRAAVLSALHEVCLHRQWILILTCEQITFMSSWKGTLAPKG
jgi:hypothetical protein